MRMKRVKVEEGAENQFERLPDEVVIEILNKLVHVKHLLRCSSVCKRFGTLIYHVRTIFFPNFSHHPTNMSKFSAARSIHIDMNDASPDLVQSSGVFIKYRALFRAHLDVMVIINTLHIHKTQNVDSSSAGRAFANFDHHNDELMVNLVEDTLKHCLSMHDLTRSLVSQSTELAQLLINTPRGKFYMEKDEIAELRTDKNSKSPSETFEAKMVHGRLELPTSGLVTPCAYIAVVRPEGQEIVMEKDLGLILGSFPAKYEDDNHEDDVGKIFDEAVNVVRKKIASNRNEDSINMHHLSLPKSVLFKPRRRYTD